eukprot:TRINITY_DN67097_c0_g1_i6.p2 TRINITY_DN67097_c0_g1~~TRINITY_DN67097_c0_g1_i6.p2  ORF type:complete len:183 (+),score=23.26 TRINITY_DN67097_c0_g1_i6:82-549(+)
MAHNYEVVGGTSTVTLVGPTPPVPATVLVPVTRQPYIPPHHLYQPLIIPLEHGMAAPPPTPVVSPRNSVEIPFGCLPFDAPQVDPTAGNSGGFVAPTEILTRMHPHSKTHKKIRKLFNSTAYNRKALTVFKANVPPQRHSAWHQFRSQLPEGQRI